MTAMILPRRLPSIAVLAMLAASAAAAQAPPPILLARVAYATRKNTAKPEGDLKAEIDAIDRQAAEASRLGRVAELRRLYAKGLSLLAGTGWSPEQEFAASLVLRTDRVFVDPSRPWIVRLEQIYAPAIEIKGDLSAHFTLRRRPGPGAAAAARDAADPVVKDLGTLDGLSRDLRDAPFLAELDLSGVDAGQYRLRADVADSGRALGAVTLALTIERDLDERLARLEKAAAGAPESVRADLRYPADYLRKVHLARVPPGGFDLARELRTAEDAARAAETGREWFKGRTGDLSRHYLLAAAGEIMPYRLFVPASYDGTRAFPLVVALHGLGGTEASFFDAYNRALLPLAEKHGMLVLAPLGYRVDGFYGTPVGTDAAARRTAGFSEQDVLETLRIVREQYRVDEGRIYLMGHSMGAMGTWAVAAKHPGIWAALGPIAGRGSDAAAEQVRAIPAIVVHGDADPTVPVDGSRQMVAALKKLGGEVQYVEVPGGDHMSVVAPNLDAVLTFFAAHRKPVPKTP
jgi:poly(3-hydroxybutyrate) depolymerase